ncbi:exporter protein [Campylobacter geochelonis]|uniref:Guanidinium exporter n=1 Tax=Campylobacter geochelonis TaxID=1780362 RepID=A0A128EEF4_9BACT|nr:multidrug efflux system protein, EmrE family [Campylobacter geochelonis]CZE45739.1 exporter protein [Campylobacter geochelonis]CZE46911.1 exporter protein [Campylobacter geochelonis]CZE50242.1 exporter protein [Campylobacter geochelonis]
MIVGGLFEAGFSASLAKAGQSDGLKFWLYIGAFLLSVGLSMFLLYKAMSGDNAIAVGTAYTVWAGIGAALSVVCGIVFFGDAVSFWRIFFLTTLILSIIGLKIVS